MFICIYLLVNYAIYISFTNKNNILGYNQLDQYNLGKYSVYKNTIFIPESPCDRDEGPSLAF